MTGPPPAGAPDPTPRPSRGTRTVSRSELAQRHQSFAAVSPQLGELDEAALDDAVREDPAAALHLLADLTTATDEALRERARRLAGRVILDVARGPSARRSGASRLAVVRAGSGDLDLDRSLDAIAGARAQGRAAHLDDLVARDWRRPDLALCLLVDASGSMTGARLAAAALTAAACAWRAPGEFAVLSFHRTTHVHRDLASQSPAVDTVTGLLSLRGHGVTSLGTALQGAGRQLATARAGRRVTVLLSDCRATDEVDPLPAARALDDLVILAPEDDADEARAFAARAGARLATMASAAGGPAALATVLSG